MDIENLSYDQLAKLLAEMNDENRAFFLAQMKRKQAYARALREHGRKSAPALKSFMGTKTLDIAQDDTPLEIGLNASDSMKQVACTGGDVVRNWRRPDGPTPNVHRSHESEVKQTRRERGWGKGWTAGTLTPTTGTRARW